MHRGDGCVATIAGVAIFDGSPTTHIMHVTGTACTALVMWDFLPGCVRQAMDDTAHPALPILSTARTALTIWNVPPGCIRPAHHWPEIASHVEGHVEEVRLVRIEGPAT